MAGTPAQAAPKAGTAAAEVAPAAAPRTEVAPAAVSCKAPPAAVKATSSRQAPVGRPVRAVRAAAEVPYAAPDAPRRMIPGDEYTVRFTVLNTTSTALPKDRYVLSYRWFLPDGSDETTSTNRLETALPFDLVPGASVVLDARVKAPTNADVGNSRERFVLAWELRDRVARKWLSETAGVAPLRQDVAVEHPTSDQLGLEHFFQYSGIATGAGSTVGVNAFSGNAVFDYTPVSNPSRGLATFVRLAYNSQDASNSYAGPGWSLSTSTLHRLGTPLQFDGGSSSPSRVSLVDGDGTSHVFELNKNGSTDPRKWTFDSPAGVHLLLQRTDLSEDRRWVMTSPDRTRMYFDTRGFQTATVDRNGNEMLFTYDRAEIGGRNTGVLRHITDATGRRTLTLDYFQPGDDFTYFVGRQRRSGTNLSNAAIAFQLRSITDVSGRTIAFTYSQEGLLQEVVDGAGTPQARAFGFFYDGTKLIRVVDPNGSGSQLTYYTSTTDKFRKGRVLRLTDRRGGQSGFQYADADGSRGSKVSTTVADQNGQPTSHLLDGFGRLEKLTNAKGETSDLVWDADNNVVRLREHNGALTTFGYDQKTGYPLEIRDAEANANDHPPIRLGYRTDLDGHVADLTEKVSPEGRRWQFVYDDRGNLVAVTDPKGTATPADGDFTSRNAYDEFGHLVKMTDANGHATTYADYDANGYPRRITDPFGCSSIFAYDAVGNVVSTVDAKRTERTFRYDVFKRPLLTRVPKDTAEGTVIETPGPRYDANGNVVVLTAANGAVTTAAYDENDQLVALTAPKDTPDGPKKVTTFAYDRAGNLIKQTEPKGNLTPGDPDDFASRFTYDAVNQRIAVTDPLGQRSTTAFDAVGNAVVQVDPKRSRTPDPNDFRVKTTYDLNRRVTKVTDAAGHSSAVRYDRDGNVVAFTDEEGNTTLLTLDERAATVESRSPHSRDGDTIRYFTTRFEYDQVGNRTRTITPRGVETADDPDDFAQTTVYDELNRVKEEHLPFDKDDERVKTPDKIFYGYDELGQLREASAPPSDGQSVRNVTRYTYFDNGWLRTNTDAFGISTQYDYNEIGEQTNRTFISAGGGSSRTMTWDYFPDGKLKSRSDDGVPVGKHVVLVDNSDANDTVVAGEWDTLASGTEHEGFDYRVATPAADSFTWKADIPASGDYEVFVRFPRGTATDATYTVEHNGGTTTRTVNQTQRPGEWVSLGRFAFTEGTVRNVTLSGKADGAVVADAVRLVRDNSGEADTEKKDSEHRYDVNDNLVSLVDNSSGALVDRYAIEYDALDRAVSIEERKGDTVRNTTRYGYDPNGNMADWRHDDQSAEFEYNERDLLAKVTNRNTAPSAPEKVTTFTYTPRADVARQTKPNGNTVDFEYFLDGLLRHQVERKKSDGPVVNEHTLEYNANSHRTKDTARRQNADDHGAFLDDVFTYEFDPRDRVRTVTKSGSDGGEKSTETYVHDANNNVVEQKVGDDPTKFRYDRNRLVSSTTGEATFNYGYDVFGRLSKVSTSGVQTERYVYDGFDRIAEHRIGADEAAKTTRYTYDPLDRTATRTADGKRTQFDYLGLSELVLTERTDGKIRKSYQYSPHGELLAQISVKDDGDQERAYFGYNAHADVESLTDEDGNNTSTYGYTAYGGDDPAAFTGADKPQPGAPADDPTNVYRFNTKRVDPASGNYDMGFRDYNPATNRFLSLDLYNGALADLGLTVNPLTMNRYSFGGGNPISMVDNDGHWPSWSDIGHAALDVVGLIPVVGEAADVANGIWYAAEGNYVDAGLSFASAIPLAGYGATAVKAGKYGAKAVDAASGGTKVADDVAAAGKGGPPAPKAPDAPPAKAPDAPPVKAPDAPPAKGPPAPPAPPKAPPAPPKAPKAPEQPKAPDSPNRGPSCPVPNSFPPGTPVVLANGTTTKPIEDVQAGEKVLATDPVTGRTEARPVTSLIDGEGVRDFAEVVVDTDGARGAATGTVFATAGHLFAVGDERGWVAAGGLAAGDWVRGTDGDLLRVVGIHVARAYGSVHNLAVEGLDTYYVVAGGAELLVHNAKKGGCEPHEIGREAQERAEQVISRFYPGRVQTQFEIHTPYGIRRVDVAAQNDRGGYDLFEVKSNKSPYTPDQRRKDAWIAKNLGWTTTVIRFTVRR